MICAMFAALLLLAGCGAGRTAGSDYGYEPEELEYELDDNSALIHVYRPSSMMGMAVSYHIHFDGEPLYRVKNKSKMTFRVTEEGLHLLRAKTESATETPIEISFGQEYYVRCGVRMGAFVGRPSIEIVDSRTGRMEYRKIPNK